MRKKAASIGAVMAAALLVLIFLSRTIYTYNIPIVTAANATIGKLRKTETAKGVVEWSEINTLYAPIDGKVSEVLVKEGDTITAGQEIALLVFDEAAIREQMAQLDTDRIRIDMSIEAIYTKIARTGQSITGWEQEHYGEESVSERDMQTIADKITAKQTDIAEKEVLYAGGTLTKRELDTAKDDLDALQKELLEAQAAYADNKEKVAEGLEKKEKDRASQIENLQYELTAYEQELRGKSLDIAENAAKKAKLEAQLTAFDASRYIYADMDGTIITLDIQKGKTVGEDQAVGTYGVGGALLLECELGIENNFVAVGDTCTISNANHTYQVTVDKLSVKDGKKQVTIHPTAESIQVGETFEISFRKDSASSYTLVPNAAVNKDGDGYFVYVVQTRTGILGDEYYVQKQPVQIGDSDSTNTVLTRGAGFFDPIVTLSDKPFGDNATVILKNEGDFIVQ